MDLLDWMVNLSGSSLYFSGLCDWMVNFSGSSLYSSGLHDWPWWWNFHVIVLQRTTQSNSKERKCNAESQVELPDDWIFFSREREREKRANKISGVATAPPKNSSFIGFRMLLWMLDVVPSQTSWKRNHYYWLHCTCGLWLLWWFLTCDIQLDKGYFSAEVVHPSTHDLSKEAYLDVE